MFFINKKIITIPLGPYYQFSYFQKESFNNDKLVLGFWGRILPYKGIFILLRAFEILKKNELNIELYILGNGIVDKKEKELIEKYEVKFINKWLDYNEVLEYMGDIDLIVLPYIKATQSAIISFCLAINMPMIVSDAGGLKEFIENGKTGFVFKTGDYKDLADKIKIIYENKNLLKIFSENIKNYKNQFDWSKNISNLLKIIE